jgi:predicted transposase YbfD/YdcC
LATRSENEKKFEHWIDHPNGNRTYCYEVKGKHGWFARYIKDVDINERTLSFRQEVYNEKKELVELHEKYPTDNGHQTIIF